MTNVTSVESTIAHPNQQMVDILQQLTGQLTALTVKVEGLENKSTPAVAPVTPMPQPPVLQKGQSTDYQNQLAAYAAQQAQEAARYRIAREFSVDPDDLSGEFENEAAMRRHGKQLADLSKLEQQAIAVQARMDALTASSTQSTTEPTVEDTGGPTGAKQPGMAELDAKYSELKGQIGEQAGANYLSTVYRDPRQILGRS